MQRLGRAAGRRQNSLRKCMLRVSCMAEWTAINAPGEQHAACIKQAHDDASRHPCGARSIDKNAELSSAKSDNAQVRVKLANQKATAAGKVETGASASGAIDRD